LLLLLLLLLLLRCVVFECLDGFGLCVSRQRIPSSG
jgi:hypothetical protein